MGNRFSTNTKGQIPRHTTTGDVILNEDQCVEALDKALGNAFSDDPSLDVSADVLGVIADFLAPFGTFVLAVALTH